MRIEGKIKRSCNEGTVHALHSEIQVPLTRIATEISGLKQQMAQKLAGGDGGENNFDPSLLPDEMFEEQAKRRAIVGLVINEIVQTNQIDVDGAKVREAEFKNIAAVL